MDADYLDGTLKIKMTDDRGIVRHGRVQSSTDTEATVRFDNGIIDTVPIEDLEEGDNPE